MVQVTLVRPTDYDAIFKILDAELSSLRKDAAGEFDLCLHLSPGTPAMAATLSCLARPDILPRS